MVMESQLRALIRDLQAVHDSIVRSDDECCAFLETIQEAQRASAINLLQYLALRRHDLRHLQPQLAARGLSSLGRTESHVRQSLETVLHVLHVLDGRKFDDHFSSTAITVETGESLLAAHTDALLGPSPKERGVRIMVTMPSEASTDYSIVRDLLAGGMDCMRINCAHDDAAAWEQIIHHLRRAKRELKRDCRVAMDLAGPKLRTGPIEPGPAVLKVTPRRDDHGRVTKPAVVALVPVSKLRAPGTPVDAVLPIDGDLPAALAIGDAIEFDDARGRSRRLIVRARDGAALIAELDRTAYVASGTALRFDSSLATSARHIVDVPPIGQSLFLRKGDTLLLTPESSPGRRAIRDHEGRLVQPASIGITLPEVFRDVLPGQPIWFDDGKIGGVVRDVAAKQIVVEITQARPKGEKLAAGKGVNVPDTRLRLAALTARDAEDLAFVAVHADLVAYSFVRHAHDVHQLRHRLAELHAEHLGIVLKIETRQAFNELPALLLAAMRGERFGVMIARGDLAVECGFERMAEVQEEILWICEAAHTPVIWATQVLESLAKTGLASRAEVTDAAMSERAECVMLNKGPFVREAVATLDNILRRMEAHQSKRRAMLRPLHVAHAVTLDLSTPPIRDGSGLGKVRDVVPANIADG
jgi:pyruvate kinase